MANKNLQKFLDDAHKLRVSVIIEESALKLIVDRQVKVFNRMLDKDCSADNNRVRLVMADYLEERGETFDDYTIAKGLRLFVQNEVIVFKHHAHALWKVTGQRYWCRTRLITELEYCYSVVVF